MNQQKIDIFDYQLEIEKLPEEWMKDMAIVFREFDEDKDGQIPSQLASHIFYLFRLPHKNVFKEHQIVKMEMFLDEASITRDSIFMNPIKRYCYYFQMIAGLGKTTIDAVDLQRFITVSGDDIALKFCEDFIDEFDRKRLSKDSITIEEFSTFCAQKKIPI